MAGLVPRGRRNNMLVNPFGVLDDFFNDNWFTPRNIAGSGFKVDVTEEDDCYIVDAELPGVKKEDVYLELNDGNLLIGVEHKEEATEEDKKFIHRERHYASMQRSLNLGSVKSDGITAKLDDGLLKVRIQKDDSTPKSNRIEID